MTNVGLTLEIESLTSAAAANFAFCWSSLYAEPQLLMQLLKPNTGQ